MRSLSNTLSAAQKSTSHVPYVKVEATNKILGVTRLDWTRLYSGTEAEYYHGVTMPGDGSLIRIRVGEDSHKLYRQRVADPQPSSDFSQWIYTGQYNVLAVACSSYEAEVSIFWSDLSRRVQRIKSTDNGVSWNNPELIDYTPTTAVSGMAAVYKPNGDLAIFFTDQSTLHVKIHAGGSWRDAVAWDKSTGELSGIAGCYDRDWDLLVTGRDTAGGYTLWSLIYGDGGEVSDGTWSPLQEITSAPSSGDFEYRQPFLDKPDCLRCFYIENFNGTTPYSRPFRSYLIPDTSFAANLWHEPVPFNLDSQYGLAMAHHGNYAWLSSPSGVWRASLVSQKLDLTADIISLKEDLTASSGKLMVEVCNDDGQYASPGSGAISVLNTGGQIELSPGYRTIAGDEVSSGTSFTLDAYEHNSSGGQATLTLYTVDGWEALKRWKARYQFRWNNTTAEMNVRQILEFVLARVGLKLEVKSQSSAVNDFYPDFTISPGNSGEAVVRRLLSYVSDVIFIEGNIACLVNPGPNDSPVYSYGSDHVILDGKYKEGTPGLNRIQVEGYDNETGEPIIADSFSWSEIDRLYDRLQQITDRNIGTATRAQERGQIYLRESEITADSGHIRCSVNCGQQLFDVIQITDERAGLINTARRVLGATLLYDSYRGIYEHTLLLGAV